MKIDKELFKKIISTLSEVSCPTELGLKENCRTCINCKQCWEEALENEIIEE